jgi:ring-1,2-phenylacetyl-CoA epoxidase subunit PaaD
MAARTVELASRIARAVPDPELPYLTLGDLGVIGAVSAPTADRVVVRVSPTYLGCPATEAIARDIETALTGAGWPCAVVELCYDPPWTPDRITARGRARLLAEGVAPPVAPNMSGPVFVALGRPPGAARCPQCGAPDTRLLSAFGSTPCQELRRCAACGEPFPAIKAIR